MKPIDAAFIILKNEGECVSCGKVTKLNEYGECPPCVEQREYEEIKKLFEHKVDESEERGGDMITQKVITLIQK